MGFRRPGKGWIEFGLLYEKRKVIEPGRRAVNAVRRRNCNEVLQETMQSSSTTLTIFA